jgi:WD40 repeat protein
LGKVILFSQNKNYLIGVDNKNRIKLWNKSSFNNYSNINQFNKTIKSIALLENNLLAIGSCDINKIEIWNVTNKSKIFDLNDHTECVNTLISINLINKTFLISGSDDTTIRLYDFKNIQTIKETSPVLKLEYNPQSQLIASISKKEKIKIWSSDGWTIFPIFLFFYYKVCTDNYLKFLTFALCREKNSL